MGRKAYDEEFLISELQRFYNENKRVPIAEDMNPNYGYPSYKTYQRHFKTWNNALEAAGFEINMKQHVETLDGTEVCSYCGKRADEILGFKTWVYPNGKRYCIKHGNSGGKGIPDYVLGNLDINSPKGLGRAGEILVVKVLNIGKEHDCNRESCHAPIDLYHKKYGWLEVKTSLYSYDYTCWHFNFDPEKDIDTYICIGLSSDRKIVEHVWIVPNTDEIRNQISISITNSYYGLNQRKRWEINAKPYNDMWQSMKLDSCKIMVDKNKGNYIEPMKQNNIINNTIKQVECVIDKAQQKLVDF